MKNNLGVDCISRDSAIKALDYDIKCFEFKSGVSKHMNDIAKLLNTIYETQVNNIKALPSYEHSRSEDCPLVEAIPKADYETRLKADMVAMLIELQNKINVIPINPDNSEAFRLGQATAYDKSEDVIQQKINSLKEQNND